MKRISAVLFLVVVAVTAYLIGAGQKDAMVKAETPPKVASQVGRYRVVELQPNAASHWSGLLDTQTGCVWAYASTAQDDHVWASVTGGPCSH